jgi:uncharacterized membrane protein YgdD (TMEM256/DUF423 family)
MRVWLIVAALSGFLAVVAGALAAHLQHGCIDGCLDTLQMATIDTAARYQMYHALAIGLAAFAMRGAATTPAQIAAALFLAGIVLFSGSLYLFALSGTRAFAMVTPFGGAAFLLGWLSLAWAGSRLPR